MRCVSVRRPTAGPGKAHVLGPSTINAPNQPICSAPYAPSAKPALLSCSPLATPRPCNSISTKSQPKLPQAHMPSSFSTKPVARRQRPQGSQKHHAPVAAAACARAHPSRKYLAVHAGELAVEPHLQILRRHRRPLDALPPYNKGQPGCPSLDLDYSYGTTSNLSCADSRMPRKLLSRLGTGCRRPSSVPEHNCIALTKCGQLGGTFPQLDRGQTKEQ
jgi:hypothetical protein